VEATAGKRRARALVLLVVVLASASMAYYGAFVQSVTVAVQQPDGWITARHLAGGTLVEWASNHLIPKANQPLVPSGPEQGCPT